MRFLSFSSGSCGNCYLLLRDSAPDPESGLRPSPSGILIDAGVSIRRMKKVLESVSLDFDCFQSVLVTPSIRRLSFRTPWLRIPSRAWRSPAVAAIW